MSDASEPTADDVGLPSKPGTAAAAAAAAAARSRSTGQRLQELEQRMARLRAGEPSTRDDVARARVAVEAQRRACALAERRMVLARQTPRRSTTEAAASAARADERFDRLRDAFVALANSRLDGYETLSAHGRRRELARNLAENATATHGGWTEALCRLAVDVVPSVSAAAVSTYDERGVAHPFAAADDRSLEIEELLQVVGEGPGQAVARGRQSVVVEDLSRHDVTWPGYVAAVREHGVAALWSLPVVLSGTVLGSLTLYHEVCSSPGLLDQSDAATLAELAAAAMIIDADTDSDPDRHTGSDAVSLASGMLAVRAGVAVDEALALLRGYAFSTGRRISDIAVEVMTGDLDLA